MKKLRVILIFFTSALILFACSAEKHYNEWVKQGNDYYYYDANGNRACDVWKQEGSDWYYLAKDGKMVVNSWIKGKENGKNYYCGMDGKMLVNCQQEINGTIYIFDAEGNGKEKPEINVVIQGLNKYMYADNYYISIDNYTYDIKKELYSDDKYRIDFDFACTVLGKGKYSDGFLLFYYKVFDANGYSIDEGTIGAGLISGGKKKGEKFKFQDSISGLRKGDYIIKFSDYKDYGVYYW